MIENNAAQQPPPEQSPFRRGVASARTTSMAQAIRRGACTGAAIAICYYLPWPWWARLLTFVIYRLIYGGFASSPRLAGWL
jgi:hypothetical protein